MRTAIAVFLGLCTLVLAGSPALGQQVNTDYDKKADFSHYKTYMWIKPPHMKDPLMNQRVMDAIDNQLMAKGLRKVSENEDLGVSANGAIEKKETLNTFYDGFGGWGWMGWDGMATTETNTYDVGTLVVDLFDANTKRVIWRGEAKDTLSNKPEKNSEKITKAVEKMFKNFPPKGSEKQSGGGGS